LTGLANRRALDDVIQKETARGLRSNKPIVVGIVDLDFFKKVNDTYGHDIGDKVLKDIAKILNDGLRAGDFAARWGGEEFCIIFLRRKPFKLLSLLRDSEKL
jgi:diguanylate cyclase (GGDEF)-like protein